MAINYNPTKWENGKTILKASHFEKIEKGITDIINYNNSIYADEDRRKENEIKREEEHNKKIREVTTLVDDLKSDYDALEKIIIDENASANLQNQINDVTSQLAHIKSNNYYPELFGAIGDGVTDDTQAFKNMLSQIENNSVIILSKKYLITDTLDIKKSQIKIIGNNPYKCGFIQKGISKEIINIFKYGFECYSVGFWGDSKDFKGSTTALNYCLDELNGNDTILKDCLFYSVFKGIELRGRNLNISNCSFQLVNECINISKHNNPDSMGDALRGIIIKDNTFHSVGSNSTDSEGIETYCIKVNDVTGLQDIVIKGNKLEAWTSTFFKGYVNGVHIIGNDGLQVAGGHKYINIKCDEANYKGFSISNNIFITNADEGNINTSNHNFIYSSTSLNNGVIANNKTNRSMKEAIKVDGDIEECIIENNDFIANQYGNENYNIIHIDGEIKKSMVVNNKLKSNKSSSKYGLYYKNESSDNNKSLIENNTSILCDFSDIQTNKKVVLDTSKAITKNTNAELLSIDYKLLSKKSINIESYLNIVNNESSTTSVVLWFENTNGEVINAESFLIDAGFNKFIKIKSVVEFSVIENNIKLFIRSGGSVTVNTSFYSGGKTLSSSFIRAYEDNTNIRI